jgi:hypothetical protein
VGWLNDSASAKSFTNAKCFTAKFFTKDVPMIVEIDRFGKATLRDPDNFSELKAVAQAPAVPDDFKAIDLPEVATACDAEHIWLRSDWLEERSGAKHELGRLQKFQKMVEYARNKGWVDDAGGIRVHWQREPI